MQEQIEGQVGLFDLDTWSGKTSPERSVPTKAKTSKPYLQKSSELPSRKLPMCLCLTRGGGPKLDASTMKWEPGALLGEFTTHSFGESPSEENVSRLSQILEDCPHPKYSLSGRACKGILNRAERRGKELPSELKAALIAQATVTEPHTQSASKNEPVNLGGAKEYSCRMSEQEPCQRSIISPSLTAGFDGSMGSKAGNIGFSEEQAITAKSTGGALPHTPWIAGTGLKTNV